MTEQVRLPRWSIDTKPYWDALQRNELKYQHCGACGETVFHPRALCPYCLSDQLEWRRSRGRGTIYSFTIQHVPVSPAWKGRMPIALGIVALDEGYHMFTQFLADDLGTLAIGRPVAVVFDRISDELVLPKFRLAPPQSEAGAA